jgi:hypothetical protein
VGFTHTAWCYDTTLVRCYDTTCHVPAATDSVAGPCTTSLQHEAPDKVCCPQPLALTLQQLVEALCAACVCTSCDAVQIPLQLTGQADKAYLHPGQCGLVVPCNSSSRNGMDKTARP